VLNVEQSNVKISSESVVESDYRIHKNSEKRNQNKKEDKSKDELN